MSHNFDSEVIGFDSCPGEERSVDEKSTQTVNSEAYNRNTQTTNLVSTAIQVSPDHAPKLPGDHSYKVDDLLNFLKRILPHLEKELKNGPGSNDFSFGRNDRELSTFSNEGHQKLGQLQVQKIIELYFEQEKKKVISLNSTNTWLALAYSEENHEIWCTHDTLVHLYHVDSFNENRPKNLLKTVGCVCCIKFCNSIPSLLAAGLSNGNVILWDLNQEEDPLLTDTYPYKRDGNVGNAGEITFLAWKENKEGLMLVTAGLGGRIILWKVKYGKFKYLVHERFLMMKDVVLGVHHMDFRSSESFDFIAACDNGYLFSCSMTNAQPISKFPEYKNPILRMYKPQSCSITHVSCTADYFASCGIDSEIRIYKYDHETPLLKILTSYKMLLGVQWISAEELISWGDSKVVCHKMEQPKVESLVFNVDWGISAVDFKMLRYEVFYI